MNSRSTTVNAPSLQPPKRKGKFSRFLPFYLMIIPAIVWWIIFHYYPMSGLLIAFQDYTLKGGFYNNKWVGFKYFKDFLRDPMFMQYLKNTIVMSIAKLVFGFPSAVILALMLNEVRHITFKRTIQTVSYLPYFVSWVVVAALIHKIFGLYNGMINLIRIKNGLPEFYFLGEPKLFLPFIVLSDIWKNVGYGSIIYLAALAGIDPTLYEAAMIDGANGRQRLFHITLPGIKMTVGIMLILAMGGLFGSNMEQVLLLQTPATTKISETLDTYILRRGIMQNQPDYAAAITFFRSVISLILIVGVNKLSKKFAEVSLW